MHIKELFVNHSTLFPFKSKSSPCKLSKWSNILLIWKFLSNLSNVLQFIKGLYLRKTDFLNPEFLFKWRAKNVMKTRYIRSIVLCAFSVHYCPCSAFELYRCYFAVDWKDVFQWLKVHWPRLKKNFVNLHPPNMRIQLLKSSLK